MKKFILFLIVTLGFFANYSNGYAAEKKVAVVYFSATGNTKRVAEMINTNIKSDIFEIVPQIPYTSNDLNYGDSNSKTTKEKEDKSIRPAIKNKIDLSQYDVVFLGYPIWWGEAPRIMNTFVENTDLNGKTIIPFVTSGSSSIGSSAKELSKQTKGATWKDGRRFGSNTSNDEIKKWVNSLGL
ncbi:flavodoxin [Fusobacterium simiae]|uniref:Flavodoxin n=1 Tax=Fusobacterium simiae TaxID=855 RepID=A0ABT4DP35_FUSSI|nr:flavodoxin [Fusobacterium simiae]MCY7009049.1 flavodoxin [Fusobacterium simiae]